MSSSISWTVTHTLTIKPRGIIREAYGTCSCGWKSGWQATEDFVHDKWNDHCGQVFLESTGEKLA